MVGEAGDHGEGHALGDGEEGDVEAGGGVAADGARVGGGEVLLEGKPIPACGAGVGIGSGHGGVDGMRRCLTIGATASCIVSGAAGGLKAWW